MEFMLVLTRGNEVGRLMSSFLPIGVRGPACARVVVHPSSVVRGRGSHIKKTVKVASRCDMYERMIVTASQYVEAVRVERCFGIPRNEHYVLGRQAIILATKVLFRHRKFSSRG